MNFVSSRADRRVSAHHTRECEHCDTAAPHPHTARRMLVVFAVLFGGVAVLAIGDAIWRGLANPDRIIPTAAVLLTAVSVLWLIVRRRRKTAKAKG